MQYGLERSVGKNFEHLTEFLAPYVEDLLEAQDHLAINGKSFMTANQEQPQWMSYYDERKIELKTLIDHIDIEVERIRTKLIRGFEKYNRDLSDTMRRTYVNNEPEFIEIQRLKITVQELYGKYGSIVECFKQRGYSLKNITTAMQASIQDSIL